MKIMSDIHYFLKEIMALITTPVFIMLTVVGNGFIGICSFIFYLLEKNTNPTLHHFVDALWWGFATTTTTGYGDITPVTIYGKILGIIMMLMGLALFSIYTALFADIILTSKKHRIKNSPEI